MPWRKKSSNAYDINAAVALVVGRGIAQGQIADFEQGIDVVNLDAHVGRFLTRDTVVADGATAFLVQVDGKSVGRIDWTAKLDNTLLRVDSDLGGDTDRSVMLDGHFSFSTNDFLL